nr:diguanylate cyclase [Paeniclostridium sordellii]
MYKDTGLLNVKAFYMNLEREISKVKRHKTELTLMLVKLPYYKETKKILGESKTNKLMKDISNVITKSTRIEDERYTIENDTIAIIMPNTG